MPCAMRGKCKALTKRRKFAFANGLERNSNKWKSNQFYYLRRKGKKLGAKKYSSLVILFLNHIKFIRLKYWGEKKLAILKLKQKVKLKSTNNQTKIAGETEQRNNVFQEFRSKNNEKYNIFAQIPEEAIKTQNNA